jgi:phasin family protein
MQSANDKLLEVARANMVQMVEAMSNTLKAVETLRSQQLEAIKLALQNNETTIEKIRNTTDTQDFIALQVEITTTHFNAVSSYWTGTHKTIQGHLAETVRRTLSDMPQTIAKLHETQNVQELVANQTTSMTDQIANQIKYWTGLNRSVRNHLADLTVQSQDHLNALQRTLSASLINAWSGGKESADVESVTSMLLRGEDATAPVTAMAGVRQSAEIPQQRAA